MMTTASTAARAKGAGAPSGGQSDNTTLNKSSLAAICLSHIVCHGCVRARADADYWRSSCVGRILIWSLQKWPLDATRGTCKAFVAMLVLVQAS